MSNEDRIRNWRARRKAEAVGSEADRVAMEGTAIAHAAADDLLPLPAHATELLAVVLDALASVAFGSIADRRRVYDALEREQERAIPQAGLRDEEEEYRRRQLRMIVRLLEADIRAGVDVFAAGYTPATLQADDARLRDGLGRRAQQRKLQSARDARRRATSEDVALDIPLQPDEAADAAILRERLARIHATQVRRPPGALRSRLAILVPLVRLQLHIIQGESRVALLWALLGPVVLLSLISSLYILSGTHFILGMDVPTFSLLGAITWIMFRQIIFRTSTAYVSAPGAS